MHLKIATSFRRCVLLVLACSFLAVITCVGLVLSGPRSIPYVSGYVESLVNDMDAGYRIKVADAVIKWQGLQDGIAIEIRHIDVSNHKNERITHLPAIDVDIDFGSLFYGQLSIEEISIIAPKIDAAMFGLLNAPNKAPQTTVNRQNVYKQFVAAIKHVANVNNAEFPIRKISLVNAQFTSPQHADWKLPLVDLMVGKVGETYKISSNISGVHENKPFSFFVTAILDEKGVMDTRLRVLDITPSTVAVFIPELAFYKDLVHKVKGNVVFVVSAEGDVDHFDFTVHAVGDKKMKGMLDLVGVVDMELSKKGNRLPKVSIDVVAYGVPINDLASYWPAQYFPLPQKWVTSRIRDGVYSRSQAKIMISPDEIDAGVLHDDSVSAEVEFEDAVVNYFDGLPTLHSSKGVAKFTNGSIDINFESGMIGRSKIKQARVQVVKRADSDFVIKVDSKFAGDAADLMKFYVLKGDGKEATWQQTLVGEADTVVKLQFPIDKPDVMKREFEVTLLSKLTNVSIANMDGYKVEDGVFDVKLYSDEMAVTGDLLLNGVQARTEFEQWFLPDAKIKSKKTVRIVVSPQEMLAFDVPAYSGASGFGIVDYVETESQKGVTAELNLEGKELELVIPEIGYKKLAGEPFELHAKFVNVHDRTLRTVEQFSVRSDDLTVDGDAMITLAENGYKVAHFSKFKIGNIDVNGEISSNKGDQYHIDLKGKKLDFSPFFALKRTQKKESEPFEYGKLNVKINVAETWFNEGVKLNDFKVKLLCDKDICSYVKVGGRFEDESRVDISFDTTVVNDKNESDFVLKTGSAGTLLRALDVSTHVQGGALELSAHYAKGKTGLHDGMLIMKDFSLLKAPVMSKILTLASFGGIVDALNGKGIRFEKMTGGFKIVDDVLHVARLKATGPSIGITAEGSLSIKNGDISLEGTAAPASLVNTLLGKIPLLGGVFKGKDSDGLIATRYSVKGKADAPDVSVNPLSLLTPGFLQRIWGGEADALPETAPAPEINTEVVPADSVETTPVGEAEKIEAVESVVNAIQ